MGDPVYATFDGRVRISQYQNGGYGNLIIIRHDNGLETYYGHLSKRLVEPNDWVTAGQVIGYGGSTGRSTGPHLHFETRYKGQSFDAERLIDFATGTLRRETFLLKRSYFSIYSKFTQDFDEEVKSEAEDKKIAAQAAAVQYRYDGPHRHQLPYDGKQTLPAERIEESRQTEYRPAHTCKVAWCGE